MTKIKIIEQTIFPKNYSAIEYLSWFRIDSHAVDGWCGTIFNGCNDNTTSEFIELLKAAKKSIKETEDDIAKLKEFLAVYELPNNN